MNIYIYDGSFEGLLTCLSICFESGETPESIQKNEQDQNFLFVEQINICTDKKKADSFKEKLRLKFLKIFMRNIYYAFLSDMPGCEMVIYDYIKLALEKGRKIDNYCSDKRVIQLLGLSKKVGSEAHRLKGLIRFQQVETGLYYARINPDHNILPVIGYHFKERLKDQQWMIYDSKRSTALIYDKIKLDYVPVELDHDPVFSDEELFFQKLWKEYHKTVAIKERANPRLQKQYMPVRYWENLIEMQD